MPVKKQCFVILADPKRRHVGLASGPYPTVEAAGAAIEATRIKSADWKPDLFADPLKPCWGTASFAARPKLESYFGVL